jgi:hypothetical protein
MPRALMLTERSHAWAADINDFRIHWKSDLTDRILASSRGARHPGLKDLRGRLVPLAPPGRRDPLDPGARPEPLARRVRLARLDRWGRRDRSEPQARRDRWVRSQGAPTIAGGLNGTGRQMLKIDFDGAVVLEVTGPDTFVVHNLGTTASTGFVGVLDAP